MCRRKSLFGRRRRISLRLANWLNLRGNEEEFEALAKFGLIPGTDSILVYPEPQVSLGMYRLEFFVHGIRHMHEHADLLCKDMNEGDRLLPLLDVQNPVDPNAIALRCTSNTILLGYAPAFYSADLRRILSDQQLAGGARIKIVRNNVDAPVQMRLLCRIEAAVPSTFRALDTDVHKPIFEYAA